MEKYDVVVIGAGISGLFTALNIDKNIKVLIISKSEFENCNTSLAQGGVAAVRNGEYDRVNYHVEDTLKCGHNVNNIPAVKKMSEESFEIIKMFERYNVVFDKSSNGEYDLGLEGGHSKKRIYHHKDYTGLEIETKLINELKHRSNIKAIKNTWLSDIKKVDGGFVFRLLREDGTLCNYKSNVCVIATGGIGQLYPYTTNSDISTGDGIAAAFEMGAKIKNINYIQFHPTAFRTKSRQSFLISEALRGAGAVLRNCNMERFMERYDKRKELAPRDIVSRSMIKEQIRLNCDKFYIDVKEKSKEEIKLKFPMIYKNLLDKGYDLTKDLIPVYPCQHYLMGGIKVDLNSKTCIDDLYAVGECSNTGVHGENRLASNSLLEGAVFGKAAAKSINSNFKKGEVEDYAFEKHSDKLIISSETNDEIRRIIKDANFVIVNKQKARSGFLRIKDINFMLKNGKYKITKDFLTTRSMAICSYLILKELI